jgi:hypothetical protein
MNEIDQIKLKTKPNELKSLIQVPGWFSLFIQSVSEIRVPILISGRTRQFMKLFSASITFCKIRKRILILII